MKRAQAAMEFLMTYGWAIMIVLMGIGALTYTGVLNPDILVRDQCTLLSSFSCNDFSITQSSIQLSLSNNIGKTVNITGIVANMSDGSSTCRTSGTTLFNPGERKVIVLDSGCSLPIGRKPTLSLSVNFYFDGTDPKYNYTVTGELTGKVQ